MITISECAAFTGLATNELVLGAVPSSRHHCLLASYLLNSHRGLGAVRAMIVSDLRGFLDLGASSRASDLLIVLRMLLTDYPEARLGGKGRSSISRAPREMALLEDFDDFERDAAEGVVISFWRNHPRDGRRARVVGRRDPDFGGDRAIARLGSRMSFVRTDR